MDRRVTITAPGVRLAYAAKNNPPKIATTDISPDNNIISDSFFVRVSATAAGIDKRAITITRPAILIRRTTDIHRSTSNMRLSLLTGIPKVTAYS